MELDNRSLSYPWEERDSSREENEMREFGGVFPAFQGLVPADLSLLHIEDRGESPPEHVRSYCSLCCIW